MSDIFSVPIIRLDLLVSVNVSVGLSFEFPMGNR